MTASIKQQICTRSVPRSRLERSIHIHSGTQMTPLIGPSTRSTRLVLLLIAIACFAWQTDAPGQTRPAQAWDDPAAVVGKKAAAGSATDNSLLYGYDKEPYPLDPGPHLFVDYRYIMPGRTNYYFPDGKEASRYGGDVKTLPGVRGVPGGAPSNIRIDAEKVEKLGDVLDNDQPWERGMGYHTLLNFNGKYRMWYETSPPADSKLGDVGLLGYAESTDGLHWVRPKLDILEIDG